MLILYSVCIFLSAFLLFLVQPMIGKMFLPLVGGSSATWNICMFFFQSLLLAGYASIHYSTSTLGVKRQSFIQFPLMIAGALFLPMNYVLNAAVPSEPSLWLIWQLFLTCGLPFFVLAGISPLLQLWFAKTVHHQAKDPFFLYSASNAGSLTALVFYPVLFEPNFDLQAQGQIWTYGYGLLFFLLLLCFMVIKKKETMENAIDHEEPGAPLDKKRIILWIAAAFIPSSLLLGVTQYMTTDLVPLPLFWVIPLIIYLLTFIIAFARKFTIRAELARKIASFTVIGFVSFFLFIEVRFFWLSLAIHLFTLFWISLYCHRFLAEDRPAVNNLTAFYLWISLGGVLGGLFNSLVAPFVFSEYLEYPLIIALSFLLLDRKLIAHDEGESKSHLGGFLMVLTGVYIFCTIIFAGELNLPEIAVGLGTYAGFDNTSDALKNTVVFLADNHDTIRQIMFLVASLLPALILARFFRVRFFPMVTTVLVLLFLWNIGHHKIYLSRRNFFGVKKVFLDTEKQVRHLAHGSTIHGKQSFQRLWRREPLTYYHRRGPLGDIFALPAAAKEDLQVAVIGLGIGGTAAYARPGQKFVFYEIDPQVAEIAQMPEVFAYLKDFAEQCEVIVGDGRLKIQAAADNRFDMILLDAFSSDAVPVHLLTLEAVQLYLQKLKENGLIVVHISNRYLDLKPNLIALAAKLDLQLAYINDNQFDPSDSANFERSQAEYALLTRSKGVVNYLSAISQEAWSSVELNSDFPVWTDSHSGIFPLLRFGNR